MPDDHKDKNLRACTGCHLVMSDKQWKKKSCVNCNELRDRDGITPYFSGMVSIMMPASSWVAKWNGFDSYKPGIYALKLLSDEGPDLDMNEAPRAAKRGGKEPGLYSDDEDGFYDD